MRSVRLLAITAVVLCGCAAPVTAIAERLALTFDDLPLNGALPAGVTREQIASRVVKILKRRKLPPSYGFINAAKLEASHDAAAALRVWVDAGQRVGNHTYSHMSLHEHTTADFMRDVALNEPALLLLSPGNDWRWFRYPYLREGDELDKRRVARRSLHERGYSIAQVTIDYEDYLWNNAFARCADRRDGQAIERLRSSYLETAAAYIDLDRRMARLVFGRQIDHVLLLHLGAFSETILPELLDLLRHKGFTFATLEEVQADPAYRTDPDAASRYGGSLLEQHMDARRIPYPAVLPKPQKELEQICR